MKDSVSPESAACHYEKYIATLDITAELPQVRAPTLVIHFSEVRMTSLETSRAVATSIPDARFTPLAGESERFVDRFDDLVLPFLNERTRQETMSELPSAVGQTGLTVILFADIVDSTALTERLGDAAFREKARHLDTSLRTIIRDHSGTPIEGKLLGDGVLATFSSARQAIEAALACGRAGDDAGLPLHLGLHAGDVISEEGNVYGGAVNIAARIAAESPPGEVLVSQTVRDLARTSAGVTFEDRGERELKGVEEPVRVYQVR
jgi:class 3 adenylate cyclase